MAKARCSICGKDVDPDFRPFCSKRCANVDLARWLTGHYRIPAIEPPDGFDLGDEFDDDER